LKGEPMNHLLKRLFVSLSLICVLTVTVCGGETPSPPCAPGETASPPCSSAQIATEDPAQSGVTQTTPSSVVVDVTLVVEEALLKLLLY
ncbi:MAG TPA: hypothetical protein VFU37_03325, partial [Pyrinomonadaceae bacterium]|nr:hypothetical protein [Pyrinomonadaceae bacterium]